MDTGFVKGRSKLKSKSEIVPTLLFPVLFHPNLFIYSKILARPAL